MQFFILADFIALCIVIKSQTSMLLFLHKMQFNNLYNGL